MSLPAHYKREKMRVREPERRIVGVAEVVADLRERRQKGKPE